MSNTPAFPTSNWTQMAPHSNGYNEGMTLRDYFAAKAMQGLFASDTKDWNQQGEWGERARTAYEMADAMMKARETNA
jgi:hypothetical protein